MESKPKRRGRPPGSKNKANIDQETVNNVMLKPSEVCDIIKTCGEHGVLSLKYGNLKLDFPELNNSKVNPIEQQTETVYPTLTPEEAEKEREAIKQEMMVHDLELLSIENPVEYERVMVGKESLDADTRTESVI